MEGAEEMSKEHMDVITTLCAYIDAIDNEAKRTLPDVLDQNFMKRANPHEISLAKIRLMVFRCKEKFYKEVENER
jgi:hypothetical protein